MTTQETYEERNKRREKEYARLLQIKNQYNVDSSENVATTAEGTFAKNGRIYILESQTLGIGIGDMQARTGYTLAETEVSLPEPDLMVIAYPRNGATICIVGSPDSLATLQKEIQENSQP